MGEGPAKAVGACSSVETNCWGAWVSRRSREVALARACSGGEHCSTRISRGMTSAAIMLCRTAAEQARQLRRYRDPETRGVVQISAYDSSSDWTDECTWTQPVPSCASGKLKEKTSQAPLGGRSLCGAWDSGREASCRQSRRQTTQE